MKIAAGVCTMTLNIARRVTLAADDPIFRKFSSSGWHAVRGGDAGLPRSEDGRRREYRALVRRGSGAGLRPGGPAGLGVLARDADVPQRRAVLPATPGLESGPGRSAGLGRRPDRHGAILVEFAVRVPGRSGGEGQHGHYGRLLAGAPDVSRRCPPAEPAALVRFGRALGPVRWRHARGQGLPAAG